MFIRTGYWFNLTSREWHKKTGPVYNPLTLLPNNMWSYQGKPTIFGNPFCDEDLECSFTEVLQYDPELDDWISLGNMLGPHTYAAVIEVPESFCDGYVTISTPTSIPTTTSSVSPLEETAALIIGGREYGSFGETLIPEVEIFGCPNIDPSETLIQPLPTLTYNTAGAYVHNFEGSDYVMICGGYQCSEGQDVCDVGNVCFTWNPVENVWRASSELVQSRRNHILIQVDNLDAPGERVMMVIGNAETTEILNSDNMTWSEYRTMPNDDWQSQSCFTQVGSNIYHLLSKVEVLDTSVPTNGDAFEPQFVVDVPSPLHIPAKCAVLNLEDPGKRFATDHDSYA